MCSKYSASPNSPANSRTHPQNRPFFQIFSKTPPPFLQYSEPEERGQVIGDKWSIFPDNRSNPIRPPQGKAFHPPGGRCPSAHTGADEGAGRASSSYGKKQKPAAHPHPSSASRMPPSPLKGEGFGAVLNVAKKQGQRSRPASLGPAGQFTSSPCPTGCDQYEA